MQNELPPLHVIVKFGRGIPLDAQGTALMAFERRLRDVTGLNCEVFLESKGDDSRLRSEMTPEQRAKL